jgi:hypothetical protein
MFNPLKVIENVENARRSPHCGPESRKQPVFGHANAFFVVSAPGRRSRSERNNRGHGVQDFAREDLSEQSDQFVMNQSVVGQKMR